MAVYFGNQDDSKINSDNICKSYREENRRKDELIQQLCRVNSQNITDVNVIKLVAPARSNEVPSLLVKIETLEDKIRQKQCDIDAKNEQMAILKKESELNRLEVEKLDIENRQLIECHRHDEETLLTYESLKHRSEYSIKLLQDQYRESQSKVAELEARIRNHLNDKEKVDHMKSNVESKHQAFLINLSKLISIGNFNDTDGILDKLSAITDQNALLNGKMHSLESQLEAAKNEAKEARETILKLMKDYEGVSQGREDLRETKVRFQSEKSDLVAQMDLLKNRLDSLEKLHNGAKEEIESKTNLLLSSEIKLKEYQFATKASETVFQSLLESLAAIVGTPFSPCAATEGAVKDKVKQLMKTVKDQSEAAEVLDQRVLMLQKQFESQYATGKQLLDQTKDSEKIRQEFISKIKILEDDLAAKDILRDNVKCEKDRMSKHIRKLADLLGIDYIPDDNDIISLLDLLEERCQEFIVKLSGGAKCLKCTSLNSQNSESQKHSRKITALKEELEAKNLKIQLLEKRIENQKPDTSVMCEKGSETNRDRVHRLQHQLEDSHKEIEELRKALVRSQSADFDIHKQIKQKQQEELEHLTETVEKLDKVRQRQAKKIAGLKSQVEEKSHMIMHQGKRNVEFKQARQLLEDLKRKEMRLNEFRQTVAEMVGVDVRCSSNPEDEIKCKIQQLMIIARSSINTPFTPYYLSQDLDSNFVQGYSNTFMGHDSCNITPAVSKLPALTADDNTPSFSKRSQIPKNKVVFQSTNSELQRGRQRSSSQNKVDERKY